MDEVEFSAFLVSRVCHDLVGPMNAVVNGLEVLEDDRYAAMRADAIKVVASSVAEALARLQFLRVALGAAGSAGAEIDLKGVSRLTADFLNGGKIALQWDAPHLNWPKDWAKLIMNAALIATACLPRGGTLRIETSSDPAAYGFKIVATGQGARVPEEAEKALHGETGALACDVHSAQPLLTHKLAKGLNAGLTLTASEGRVELVAG